jgi:hypothetical protein
MRANRVLPVVLLPVLSFSTVAFAAPASGADTAQSTGTSAPAGGKTPVRKHRRAKSRTAHDAKKAAARTLPDPHAIDHDVMLTPFPSHAAETRKALEQNRREQLADAERAAREGSGTDRWDTVLFDVRELDSRADTEACFWRVVAYYRKGEIDRARALRTACELPAKDDAVAEGEDARASQLRESAAPPSRGAGAVADAARYDGPAPTRVER